jgi:uncharacterized protein (DUF1015 family)
MAYILPFKALRFDTQKVKLEDVLTQPYDKITPAMQEQYYAKSPHNLIRVELGKPSPNDMEADNVYTRANTFLKDLRKQNILAEDSSPSIYAYSQTFTVPTNNEKKMVRRGFIALGRLHDYSEKIVYRHEQTLTKPKADRINLLRSTKMHTGQIFMLYPDAKQEVETMIWRDVKGRAAEGVMTDEYGVLHQIWRVFDTSVILQVRDKMKDMKLIIADGHHRYETALSYRNERRAEATARMMALGRTGNTAVDLNNPFESLMMTFVNMHGDGLLVLPTHRLVHGLRDFSITSFLEGSAQWFNATEISDPAPDAIMKTLREAGEFGSAIAMVTQKGAWLLRAKEDVVDCAGPLADYTVAQKKLDVLRLHKLLLEDTLHISEQDIKDGKNLIYLRSHQEGIERVRSGADSAQVVFLMSPVTMEQMQAVAFEGNVMPQKSTDFYPKLMSGITMQSVE